MPIVSKKSDSITARIAARRGPEAEHLEDPEVEVPDQREVRRRHELVRELRDPRSHTRPRSPCRPTWFIDGREDRGEPGSRSAARPSILRATSAEVMAAPPRTRGPAAWRGPVRADRRGSLPTITMPPLTQPDDGDEQADPDPDGALEVHGDRVQDRLAEAGEHEDARSRAPSMTITPIACGHVSPSAATSVNVTKAFKPEAGRDRERVVRVDAHRDRHDPGDERRDGEHLRRTPSVCPSLS